MTAIDYWCNLFTPDGIRRNYLETAERDRLAFVGRDGNLVGYEPPAFLDYLTRAGVDKILIPAIVTWSYMEQRPLETTTVDQVVEVRRHAPDRIFGLYGVNPFRGMAAVAELEHAVKSFDFKGIHIHPHGFGLRPDHAYYFPFYAKCQELGVAAVVATGHTLDFMPIECGRPVYLDAVALYFPELRIVCAHTGWPWVEEAIAIAWKHPNVFIGTSAYAPKYWTPELVRFLDSRRGSGKVLWGTDWPLIGHEESLHQIRELGLKESSILELTRNSAARVFGMA